MTAINRNRIPYKPVLKFLDTYNLVNESDFNQLKTSEADHNTPGFFHHRETYLFNAPLEKVWHAYAHGNPAMAWNNKHMNFAFVFNRNNGKLHYPDEAEVPALVAGSFILLNLKFLFGRLQLVVGHEVAKIDEANRIMQTNYLENSKSNGSQYLRFFAVDENTTRMTQDTHYTSHNWFRDRVVYPTMHTVTISAFHLHMKKLIEHSEL